MILKKVLKKIFYKFGLKVVKLNSDFITRLDPFLVQKKIFDSTDSKLIIFDVGAHHGKVAKRYKTLFSNSKIFCFEPFPSAFTFLSNELSNDPSFNLYQVGLGDINGVCYFNSNKFEMTNSLLDTDYLGDKTWGPGLLDTKEVIEIESKTIDKMVVDLNLSSIDILKMDVQGAEYKVLNGAKNLLSKGGVKVIYMEIITMPTYLGQWDIVDYFVMLRELGYKLVGLYNYSYSKTGELRQVDAIFLYS